MPTVFSRCSCRDICRPIRTARGRHRAKIPPPNPTPRSRSSNENIRSRSHLCKVSRSVGGGMSKRTNPRGEQLRRALAQEAARIMSEQGIDDYWLAKRKAAERLGATDIAVLPKNTEIEAALAEHQRLFQSDTHSSALSALRRTALEAMRLLRKFEPRLVGPVLSGTASAHSEVNLHLFADGAETVALHLMDSGVPHRMAE